MIKFNKKWITAMLTMMVIFYANLAYAQGIQDTKLVTGTKKLFEDATVALMILSPIAGVVLIIYFLIRKSGADEVDQKKWNTRINIVIICVIGVVLTSTLINVLMSYYQ